MSYLLNKNLWKRILFPYCVDSTVIFNSIYERKYRLLNEHSDAEIHKRTDTAQIRDKGRKKQKRSEDVSVHSS
jgi:hypothetical protein